jgi:lipoyl(octanoyl) transferase
MVIIRHLGLMPYKTTYLAMTEFTASRTEQSLDEIWLLQHHAVYTLGLAAKTSHILDIGAIPLEPSDRGGQVTYHAPGQLIVYVLIDLKRRAWGVKKLVQQLEQAVIDYLADLDISAHRVVTAPGVYVQHKKIASLGLRIKRGCSYHGLSLNVDLDLNPFQNINPCGYPGLEITRLIDLGINNDVDTTGRQLLKPLLAALDYDKMEINL